MSRQPNDVTALHSRPSVLQKIFMTTHHGGKPLSKGGPFGHYMFEGPQRVGKTVSCSWFADRMYKKYTKLGKKVFVYSNVGIGIPVKKSTFYDQLISIQYDPDKVHIFLIDEIHTWFPQRSRSVAQENYTNAISAEFGQIEKRNIFVLSTAQVYGDLHISLRKQNRYMVHCRRAVSGRTVNEFIPPENIRCDDRGYWSGFPTRIMVHGLCKNDRFRFNTHSRVSIDFIPPIFYER